jgi:predicted nucleotidyltransferase
MLKDILIKTAEQQVLSLFVTNPEKPNYTREISKTAKISLGAASNALKQLEQCGILVHEMLGRTKLYKLTESNPFIRTIKILNILLVLESLIAKLMPISRRIIIYGSYASGTFAAESDLDMFLVSEKKEEILNALDHFKRKIPIDIRPLIKSQTEWMELEKSSPEFFEELTHGIPIWEKPIDESGF